MTKRIDWYFSKEAKRGRTGHLAGHFRLGSSFSKCGKTLGRKCSGGFFDPCAACEIELNKELERTKKRVEMATKTQTRDDIVARAEADPAYAVELGKTVAIMSGQKEPITPELDRMARVKDKSHAIGEFLDWLEEEKRLTIAETHTHGPQCLGWDEDRGKFNPRGMDEYCRLGPDGKLWALQYSKEKLLAEFFKIDLDKVEAERRAMLDSIRAGQ